eukprot:12255926-Alexandrium_andersonii.AAC.1
MTPQPAGRRSRNGVPSTEVSPRLYGSMSDAALMRGHAEPQHSAVCRCACQEDMQSTASRQGCH